MTQSSSQKNSQEYTKHEIIDIVLKKCLHAGKFGSEYVFFCNPMKKEISRQKCDKVKYPISIDINSTDRKRNHDIHNNG
jgi:hypothetical protein